MAARRGDGHHDSGDGHILPPGPRDGIVVNIPEHRLYYFPKPLRGHKPVVVTYPVSIGKMDWQTPMGLTHVVSKQKNPTWNPPALGARAEHLANGDPLPSGVVPSGPRQSPGTVCDAPWRFIRVTT